MKSPAPPPSRRLVLQAGAAAAIGHVVVRPAAAQDAAAVAVAVSQLAGGKEVRRGRVKMDVAKLVDNGNVVPLRVTVDSPQTPAEHVTEIAVFNEKNPQKDVARFTLGPRAAKADVATRIRLATSQKLTAVARMSDGSVWSDSVDVVVVLAACIEGETN
jgi:sulfur-oxidizing protein SoxY